MNRYDLHVARNQFDEFVKVELAPNGGWVMYQDAAAHIAKLEAALEDMAKHVWRGDWDKLKPETRAILEPKK